MTPTQPCLACGCMVATFREWFLAPCSGNMGGHKESILEVNHGNTEVIY
jgi:hypothetical protein